MAIKKYQYVHPEDIRNSAEMNAIIDDYHAMIDENNQLRRDVERLTAELEKDAKEVLRWYIPPHRLTIENPHPIAGMPTVSKGPEPILQVRIGNSDWKDVPIVRGQHED